MTVSDCGNVLLLAQDRSEAADLCAKGSSDMLGAIRDEILNTSHDVIQENVAVNQSTEARDLAGDGSPHLSLVIFQEFYECRNKISGHNLIINCLRNLYVLLVIQEAI